MRAISNAMLWQMEVVQKNRWTLGPLELVFIREPLAEHLGALPPAVDLEKFSALQFDAMVYQWNQSASGGWVRAEDVVDYLAAIHPRLNLRENPNLIFVPQRADGLSQLHLMLASLLPDAALARLGMKRQPANISLNLVGIRQLPEGRGGSDRAGVLATHLEKAVASGTAERVLFLFNVVTAPFGWRHAVLDASSIPNSHGTARGDVRTGEG